MTWTTVDGNFRACLYVVNIYIFNLLRASVILDSSGQDQRPRWKYSNISQLVVFVGNNSDCTAAYGLEQWRYIFLSGLHHMYLFVYILV